MEKLALPFVLSSILMATVLVVVRHYWVDYTFLPAIIVTGVLVSAVIALSAVRARKHFESRADALVRLESSMGLHSSLTAAAAGHTSWPLVPEKLSAGIQWNYRRLTLPLIGSLALLTAAFIIPIEAKQPPVAPTAPKAWQNMIADLAELKQKDMVQDDYLKEIEDKLDQLQQQQEKDWYSQSSLEATENLRKSHQQNLAKVSRNLEQAEKSLDALKKHSKEMSGAQKKKLLDQFNNAMQALEKGQMKPNKELLDQLKQIDPKMLNKLSPEQLDQLRENMRNMSDELKKQLREGLKPAPGEQNLQGEPGQEGGRETPHFPGEPGSREPGTGEPGQNLGGQGNDQDPQHVPKVLGDEAQEMQAGQNRRLNNKDLDKSLPGELLETLEGGAHKVDLSKSKTQQGGKTENTGEGGEEVWKSNYLPTEKRALRKFFK